MWTGVVTGTGSASRDLAVPGARWAFTDRLGGASSGRFTSLNLADHVGDSPDVVAENRRTLSAAMGVKPGDARFMQAEHSNRVQLVVGTEQGLIGEAEPSDGLVTRSPGIALVALAADCVPIVLIDVENQVVGAVHCGWPGVVARVVFEAAAVLWQQGAHPDTTIAMLGPAVCSSCYPVPLDRADAVAEQTPGAVVRRGNQWYVDVRNAVEFQFAELGVKTSRVGGCTAESPELFSYRRDRVCGRQAAAVALL